MRKPGAGARRLALSLLLSVPLAAGAVGGAPGDARAADPGDLEGLELVVTLPEDPRRPVICLYRDLNAVKKAVKAESGRLVEGAEIALLFTDVTLQGQTADGRPIAMEVKKPHQKWNDAGLYTLVIGEETVAQHDFLGTYDREEGGMVSFTLAEKTYYFYVVLRGFAE